MGRAMQCWCGSRLVDNDDGVLGQQFLTHVHEVHTERDLTERGLTEERAKEVVTFLATDDAETNPYRQRCLDLSYALFWLTYEYSEHVKSNPPGNFLRAQEVASTFIRNHCNSMWP